MELALCGVPRITISAPQASRVDDDHAISAPQASWVYDDHALESLGDISNMEFH